MCDGRLTFTAMPPSSHTAAADDSNGSDMSNCIIEGAKACTEKPTCIVEISSRKSSDQLSKHEECDGLEANAINTEPLPPRRADRLTIPILLVLAVGGLERAAFYAISTPWRRSSTCKYLIYRIIAHIH